LRVVLFCGGVLFVAAPRFVAIVAAVMGIPAKDIPKLRPTKFFPALTGEDPGGVEPGARGGNLIELAGREDSELGQQGFNSGDALAGGANVSALTAERAALGSQTVVSLENYSAATEQVGCCVLGNLQDGPANRTVADIKSKVKVSRV
jgi:hypothetical protein